MLKNNCIKYENHSIKTVFDQNYMCWFDANDVALALNYDKKIIDKIRHKKSLKDIDTLECVAKPNTLFLSEAGIREMMWLKESEIAKKFSDWAETDVLPVVQQFGVKQSRERRIDQTDPTDTIASLSAKIDYLEQKRKMLEKRRDIENYSKRIVIVNKFII